MQQKKATQTNFMPSAQRADASQASGKQQIPRSPGRPRDDNYPESRSVADAAPYPISPKRRQRESGAMLLAVLFMMAVMIIVALAVAPSFVMQARRDREEEMIHRGTEYARAIKKYYKKFGRYPANLEQLDNTNQIRFLRRRYKDPLTKDGEWKLLHYGDIALLLGANAKGVPGQQVPGQQVGPLGVSQNANLGLSSAANATGTDQSANTALNAAQQLLQQQSAAAGNQAQVTPQQTGGNSPFTSGPGSTQAQSGFSLGNGPGTGVGGGSGQTQTGQTGSNNTIFGNTGVGGQTFGGGAIVGVASKDKDTTIRIFNKKKTYDEWVFIYNPAMDYPANVLLRGPYNGQTMSNTQIGTPAGQLNQQNQGQQPGAFGQQPGGYGQQNPQQQLTPGNQFPPDQSQPH
jgi:type II secretory pathway pseudopilin PulG